MVPVDFVGLGFDRAPVGLEVIAEFPEPLEAEPEEGVEVAEDVEEVKAHGKDHYVDEEVNVGDDAFELELCAIKIRMN